MTTEYYPVTSREALHSSKSVEWYTPEKYLDAVREVFDGPIYLDPASSYTANQHVDALTFFDEGFDGLRSSWEKPKLFTGDRPNTVFCNPPYGPGVTAKWVDKMIAEYEAGHFDEGILLVNAATDTKWFRELWRFPICFVDHRIKFISPTDERAASPTHASAFVYFGPAQRNFAHVFKQFGPVIRRSDIDLLT